MRGISQVVAVPKWIRAILKLKTKQNKKINHIVARNGEGSQETPAGTHCRQRPHRAGTGGGQAMALRAPGRAWPGAAAAPG